MTPEEIALLESRLPDLGSEERLSAMAQYFERLPDRFPLAGDIQGETLHIACLIRDLAKKIAA